MVTDTAAAAAAATAVAVAAAAAVAAVATYHCPSDANSRTVSSSTAVPAAAFPDSHRWFQTFCAPAVKEQRSDVGDHRG